MSFAWALTNCAGTGIGGYQLFFIRVNYNQTRQISHAATMFPSVGSALRVDDPRLDTTLCG
jgi:hypothetical protein